MTRHWRSKAIASGTQNRHFDVDSFPLIVTLDSATQPNVASAAIANRWLRKLCHEMVTKVKRKQQEQSARQTAMAQAC